MSNLTWWLNPRFLLDAPDAQTVTVVLRQCNPSNGNLLPIGFYITKSDEDGRPFIEEEADIIGRSPFEPALDISVTLEIEAHERPLMIVPCTFHPDMEGDFELVVYCEKENTGMEMLTLPELSASSMANSCEMLSTLAGSTAVPAFKSSRSFSAPTRSASEWGP